MLGSRVGEFPSVIRHMRITVEILGPLRRFIADAGNPTTVDIPDDGTVSDTLGAVGIPDAENWNAAVEGQLVYSGSALKDGDRLLVFSPIAGG